MHKPVCVKCQRDMSRMESGRVVLDRAAWGPYQLWFADLWKCPSCGFEIMYGFGNEPFSRHFEDDFEHFVDKYREELVEAK